MEGLELICFQIISEVGSARSYYMEAIEAAKEEQYDEAENFMKLGDEAFIIGHQAHARLIQMEANDKLFGFKLLLVHAEDQLMSAETFKLMAGYLIDLYRSVRKQ